LDQWLGCLAGGGIGVLVVCSLAIAALVSLRGPTFEEAPPTPSEYDIEAVIEEDYINRTMQANISGLPSPVPVIAAYLDVRPGGQGEFTARIRAGSFEPIIHGIAVLRPTSSGQLEVELADVRLGFLPITAFVPQAPIDEMNVAVNQMMKERMGPLEARVIGVGGDEKTLRFYLAADL
jgi:hypothetical protein